ncbi:orf1 [Groundnut rosette virus]|nr:orf1 [Groundnut rosette virus]CAA93799.1 orf1 [Groundnut rosette virus]
MATIRHIMDWLRPTFTPLAGVKSRQECIAHYGDDWALMITQSRMTLSAEAQVNAWYEGGAEVNGSIPSVEGNAAAPQAAAVVAEPPHPSPAENEGEDASWVAALPAPPTYEVVQGRAPTLEEIHGASRLQIVPYTGRARVIGEDEVLPSPVLSSIWRATRCPGRILRVLGTLLKPGACQRHLEDLREVQPQVCVGNPCEVKLQEEGAPMAYMNAQSIAMELRAMFGWQAATPANRELGNRVARDILRDGCGATREQIWYMSSLALHMWFQPTLCDLAIKAGAQNF